MATQQVLTRWACALLFVFLGAPMAMGQGIEGEGAAIVEGELAEGEVQQIVDDAASPEGALEDTPPVMPAPQRAQPPARAVRRPIERREPRQRDQRFATPPAARVSNNNSSSNSTKSSVNQGAKNGGTAGEDIEFDFDGAQIKEVIESIARLTGRNFEFDPNLGASQVTVITHDKIPPEMAFEFLESILASRQFSMVETLDGHLIKIQPTPQVIQSEKPELVIGTRLPEGYDGYSTHIIPIQFANPEELSQIVQSLGSQQAQVQTYLPTNTLIITDTADGIRRMMQFIELADIPGSEVSMEIFTLEFTRAEIIAGQIEQVLLDSGGGGGAAQPGQQRQPVRTTRRPSQRQVPGQNQNAVVGSNDEELRTVADERLNALIVLATPGMMENVRDLVMRLDTPTPYESNNLHVYQLLNADAEAVEQALQPLVSTAPRRQGGAGGQAGGGGAAGGAEIQPFEQQVQITRYDETNSLLVVASPQDYKVLEAFISRLDVPQRQVNVLATVMDVTITDQYGVVVDAAGLTGNDGFGLTSTSQLSQVAAVANDIGGGETGDLDISGAASDLAFSLLGLGLGGGLTAGIFDDIDVDLPDGTTVSVPFVPLLFQAVETMTDLEVLSLPSITTVDNEEAAVTVGQEVPFVTNQRRPVDNQNNNNNFNFNSFNSIRREDVGVQLTVTPQISEGDNVRLEMNLEISEIAPNQIGDVNLLGPTTNKNLIENTVTVKDGSTAVLAGLIRDTASHNRTQVPVMGDLPVLGWLFRNRGTDRRKQNLVALVTPHIIKDHVDMERVTHFHVSEYQQATLTEFLQKGFFKKVKKRHDDRKRFRPTNEKAESIIGRRANPNDRYGRGDLER